MHALILALILGASGSGTSHSAGVVRTPAFMGGYFASIALSSPRATLLAPKGGRATGMNAERTVTGTGLGNVTVSLMADGVSVCDLEFACVGTGNSSGACSGTFAAGVDLHLEVTAETCLTMPTFVATVAWLW